MKIIPSARPACCWPGAGARRPNRGNPALGSGCHWPVPLVVGQERVVFIDRNVRIGVPPASAKERAERGWRDLPAREQAPSRPRGCNCRTWNRRADPARHRGRTGENGPAALEPVRIVEAKRRPTHYGEPAAACGTGGRHAGGPYFCAVATCRNPVAVVLTRYAAQNLYAPLRTVEPSPASAA